jgi:hypothetical protein
MLKLGDIQEAEKKVLGDIGQLLATVRALSDATESLQDGAARLRQIRTAVYENLNQIQHEHLIIRALAWLRGHGFGEPHVEWYWNPRQTGDSSEPDLQARDAIQVIASAEATTSEEPDGVIDSRMRDTVIKLNRMAGRRFYFVQTDSMAQRARTKVLKNSLDIEVVRL